MKLCSILFIFLAVLGCNVLSLPLWDLSTDGGALLAYNTITEQNLGADDLCIHRPDGLKEIVVIGLFAHDRGCAGDELFVRQTLGRFNNLTDDGLALNGWNNRLTRVTLAQTWVEEVLLAWRTPLHTATDDFQKAGKPFTPPVVQTLLDGRVQVEIWILEPAGMLPQADYTLLRIIFDEDGNLSEQTDIDQFTASFEP